MLKYIDNYGFWTTTPGTFTTVPAGTSVSSGQLRLIYVGPKVGPVVSNNLTAQTTYIINTRVSLPQGHGNHLYTLYIGGVAQCSLVINNIDGKLQFHRGENLTSPVGPASVIALLEDASTFYDIEAKFVVGPSGSVELRVNGGVTIPSTSGNTSATGGITADSFGLASLITFTQSCDFSFEHLLVMDGSGTAMNDFQGPLDVFLLPPTGDGFYTEWDFTGAASRWEAVDELNPDGDTSYISDAVVGQRNLFTHGSLPANYTAVKGAAIWTYARRDDETTRAFKNLLRNTTPADNLGSVEHFAGDDYLYFFQPYEVNPFTTSAWTISEINDVQYGVQVTT